MRRSLPGRRGFSMLEAALALGLLATALTLASQLVVWDLAERRRNLARQEAIEAAANVLEAARACPWEKLDAGWAAAQRLPEPLAERVKGGRFSVVVKDEPSGGPIKRVSVEIEGPNLPAVHASSLFSARTSKRTGGKP